MRLSDVLLDAVEAVLPGAEAAGLRTQDVYDRVALRRGIENWSRTTIRHALGALARAGRAEFTGTDHHRHYRRARDLCATHPPTRVDPCSGARGIEGSTNVWRDYGARPDGNVRLPSAKALADFLQRASTSLDASSGARQGLHYENVRASDLRREENLPGWRRRLAGAELTRVVFGDPHPDRVRWR